MNIRVNFFSTPYMKRCAGWPSLLEQIKVQVGSMDELPCYTKTADGFLRMVMIALMKRSTKIIAVKMVWYQKDYMNLWLLFQQKLQLRSIALTKHLGGLKDMK